MFLSRHIVVYRVAKETIIPLNTVFRDNISLSLFRNPRAVPDSTMKILIDNGHGIQTKGKRSPDGTLLEYAYTRDLARQFFIY